MKKRFAINRGLLTWWLRSPNVNNANNVYYVTAAGSVTNNNANNTNGVSLDYSNEFFYSEESKCSNSTETSKKNRESQSLPRIKKAAKSSRRRRHRNIYDVPTTSSDIFTIQNLLRAINECAKSVGWKNSVMKWKLNPLTLARKLHKKLHDGTYKLSPYMQFEIFYPKHRIIKSLIFEDRVVQRVMCFSGLYYYLTKGNIYDNGACQVNKGTSFALDRFKVMMRKYYFKHGNQGWVLRLDIHKFFDSIPHDQLKQMVYRKVKDSLMAKMVCDIIDSFGKENKGLGLGSQISQLLAISYLSDFDHYIKEQLKIKYYVRYSDDIVLIHEDKKYLQKVWKRLIVMLTDLGLELNPKSTLLPLSQGVDFLKFKQKITDTGKILVIPKKQKFSHMKRKIRKMSNKNVNKLDIIASFVSWASFVMMGNVCSKIYKTKNFLKGFLK